MHGSAVLNTSGEVFALLIIAGAPGIELLVVARNGAAKARERVLQHRDAGIVGLGLPRAQIRLQRRQSFQQLPLPGRWGRSPSRPCPRGARPRAPALRNAPPCRRFAPRRRWPASAPGVSWSAPARRHAQACSWSRRPSRNTRLASTSSASSVIRSCLGQRPAATAANRRLAWRRRARSRALRIERALAKCSIFMRSGMYSAKAFSASALKR